MKRMYLAVTLFLALMGLLLPAAGRTQELPFFDMTYDVGDGPVGLLTGDFNGDGKPDLVIRNYSATYVSVLLNKGGGALGAKINAAVGGVVDSMAAGDLNGDGKLDLVMTSNGIVSVLLGNGDGTFAPHVDYAAPGSNAALADFNGDGKLDIVVFPINTFGATNILLNNGNGTFAVPIPVYAMFYPYAGSVGDFNGDGKPDLVTAVPGDLGGSPTNYYNSGLFIQFNDGTGRFPNSYSPNSATIRLITGYYPDTVIVSDLNGDGRPDLLTSSSSNDRVSVFINTGGGTFAPRVDYTTAADPKIFTADINGDGKPDLIIAGGYPSYLLSIRLNNGDGTFAAPVDYPITFSPDAIASGDFNGDGKIDLAFASQYFFAYSSASKVDVFLSGPKYASVSGNLILEGIAANAPAQPITFTFRSPGFPDFAPTTNIPLSGAFSVLLPKRNGTLHIKGSKYLAANVNVNATSGSVSGVTAFLRAGDANNDNSVDATDFGLLVGAYNSDITVPGSGYDPNADFDLDGMVDATDFGLFVGNYNTLGAP